MCVYYIHKDMKKRVKNVEKCTQILFKIQFFSSNYWVCDSDGTVVEGGLGQMFHRKSKYIKGMIYNVKKKRSSILKTSFSKQILNMGCA